MSRDAFILVVLVLVLTAVGLVMLYSSTAVAAERSAKYHDAEHFLKKQLLWVALSIAALVAASRIPYRLWARGRYAVLGVTVLLLAMVLVPGVGAELNGARRWIRAGGWFFQPSEAAKIGLAIFLCGFAAADPERLKRFFPGFLPAFAAVAVTAGLILVEPDVGTSIFLAVVMMLTLVVAGARMKHLAPVGAAGAAVLAIYALTHLAHVSARVEAWLHPELDTLGKGHQITQSFVAMGSGGWLGSGLGRGMAKLYFLPEVHSDFIFPVIGEELGFAGAAAVILLYLAVGLVGYRIMQRASGRFGFLLSFAITTLIILQAAINGAVVTALVPTKGIPLPFVSAGGSSILFAMAGVGILVNISNASEAGPCPGGDDVNAAPQGAASPGA